MKRSTSLLFIALAFAASGCRSIPNYPETSVGALASMPADCHVATTADGRKLCSTRPDLKVALFGDQSLGDAAHRVLELVKSEGADVAIDVGDFDYADDPRGWDQMLDAKLGADFPLLGVVGNHDVYEWPTYAELLQDRFQRTSTQRAHCTGDQLVRSTCSFDGLYVVGSGIGTLGDNEAHLRHIDEALRDRPAVWKICAWHKNQHDMQAGNKEDAIGWKAYQLCQQAGAIVVTGHEHVYSRTRALGAVGDHDAAHGATGADDDIALQPGRTMAIVSGLGGKETREVGSDQAQAPWWASIVTNDFLKVNGEQRTPAQPIHGALFITFHVDGDPLRARGYFKTIGGEVLDRFELRYTP
ncbi:MAG: metallophosphoesterase [Myxococcales bacterium]|nr:metallophosphoesterase [Myxococcales bacterium]